MKTSNYFLAGICVLALSLRLAALGVPEFWYDEAFTALLAKLPWRSMMVATAGDTHPPAYYALAWLWSRLIGTNEFQLRLLSVLAGVAAVPVCWRVMRRLYLSTATRWAVIALMAIGPFQVYFSQEARMYSLLQLFYLLAVLAILERRWWMLGLTNLGLVYLHNYGLFYLPVLGLLGLYRERRLTAGLALSLLLPILAWMPWAVVLLAQLWTISSGYWIEQVTLGQIIYTLTIFLFGPFTRQFVLAAVVVAIGALVYALIHLAEVARLARDNWVDWPEDRLIVLWLTAAPIVLSVAASLLVLPVYLYRGLIGTAPFLYMLVLSPLAELPAWRRAYALGIVGSMAVIGLAGYWLDIADFKSSTLYTVRIIQNQWRDGDILYSTNDGNWVMFTLYQDQPVYLMPQCADHDRGALSSITRSALGVRQAELAEIPHRRAWVLWNWGAPTSKCNHDRAAELIGDLPPWYMVEETDLMSSGVWLLDGEN